MSRRAWLLSATVLVAVVVVVGVIVLAGGEDAAGDIRRGDSAEGFPLRGSLAGDDDAIAGAVAAWREQAPDDAPVEGDVTVLWIGRAGFEDVAIMADRFSTAEVTRDGDDAWELGAVRFAGADPNDSCAPTGVGSSALAPDCGRWRYAAIGDGETAAVDGLFRPARTDPQGILYPQEPGTAQDALNLWVIGGGRVTLYEDDLAEVHAVLADGQAAALWAAVRSAQAGVDRLRDATAAPGRETMTVFWQGSLPEDGPGVGVTVEEQGRRAVALGYGPADDAQAALLGAGPEEGRVAAGTLELGGRPYLALAGPDAETVALGSGAERIERPGPLALIDLTARDSEGAAVPVLPAAP